jgi:hypothetical protein
MAIFKIIPGDSQEELIKQAGQMIQVYESGKHIKSAASRIFSRGDLEGFAPPPGQFLSHMITMGSAEMYGANRNCWFTGEPVRTPDGFRAIDTLVVGDYVLTDKNRYRKVTKVFKHLFNGNQVAVETTGMGEPSVCTAEHPLLVIRADSVRPEVLYARSGKRGARKRPGSAKADERFGVIAEVAGFEPASTIKPGDWVAISAAEKAGARPASLDKFSAWVFGLFLADGCTYREYRDIGSKGQTKGALFTLGSGDDVGVIPALQGEITKAGNRSSVGVSYTSEEGRRIQWGNAEFARTCDKVFGKLATLKTLSNAIFGMPEAWKLEMLAGWFDGDGCLVTTGSAKYRGTLTGSTASLDLACSAQRLLASVGIPSCLNKTYNCEKDGCFGKGDLVIYQLAVGPAHSDRILRFSNRMRPHGRQVPTYTTARIHAGRLWVKVKKVTLEAVEAVPCFNLEVEEDHTYVTKLIGHNCDSWPHEELKKSHDTFVTHAHNFREHKNQSPDYAIGTIKAARYDENLQRGEILMWTDIDKAAAEFEKARKGEEQSGSMAASVDRDVCEGCGFVSKWARERCEHIRDTPGKWLPQFKKYARMINFGPIFKDYSFVGRPADRIAHTMNYLLPREKLAGVETFLRGDQLAAAYGLGDTTWKVALARIAAFDAVQQHPAKQAAASTLFCRAFDGQFDAALLEKMAAHPYPARVLQSLAKRAMVMPLASFHSFVTGTSLVNSLADPVVKQAAAMLPQLREELLGNEGPLDFGSAVDQFEPSSACCDDLIDNFLDAAQDQFALRYEALAKRAHLNPRRPAQPAARITGNSEAYGLAALYNAYLTKVAETLPVGDWIGEGQLAALR